MVRQTDSSERPLLARQERFISEYLVDHDVRRAAIAAGYAPKAADAQGRRLLRNTTVRRRVNEGMGELQERTKVDAEFVVHGLTEIATDAAANPMARVRAYELLGKHLGIFVERKQIEAVVVVQRNTPSLNPDFPPEFVQARQTALLEASRDPGREGGQF